MNFELTISNRKIKKLLKKHFTKKEGQKVRIYLKLPNDIIHHYRAQYFIKVEKDGVRERKYKDVDEDTILDVVRDYLKDYDINYIITKLGAFFDPVGFLVNIHIPEREKAPKRELTQKES